MFLFGLIVVDQSLPLQAEDGVLAEVGGDHDLLLHAGGEGADQVLLLQTGGEGVLFVEERVMFDLNLQAGGESFLGGVLVEEGLMLRSSKR